MGKVGSKSVHLSLKKAGYNSLFHTHSIRHDSKYPAERKLFKYINIDRKPVKIISMAREPVSRNISSFFEQVEILYNMPQDKIFDKVSINQLIKDFFDKFYHSLSLYWFDYELRNLTGIDIYKYKFKQNRIINQKPFELLLLRAEDTDELKEELISNFLQNRNFKFRRLNQTSKKTFHDIYSEFKKKIVFDFSYIDEMYSSKYVKHFYSSDEINTFYNIWNK